LRYETRNKKAKVSKEIAMPIAKNQLNCNANKGMQHRISHGKSDTPGTTSIKRRISQFPTLNYTVDMNDIRMLNIDLTDAEWRKEYRFSDTVLENKVIEEMRQIGNKNELLVFYYMMLKYYHMDRHSEDKYDYIHSRLYITTKKLGINTIKDLMMNIDKFRNEPVWKVHGYEVRCENEEYECLRTLGVLWLLNKPSQMK
jgi:hypothetical protein